MSPTWIDIDDEALRETMRFSGARNQDDAVNLALRVFAARHRSRAETLGERGRTETTAGGRQEKAERREERGHGRRDQGRQEPGRQEKRA